MDYPAMVDNFEKIVQDFNSFSKGNGHNDILYYSNNDLENEYEDEVDLKNPFDQYLNYFENNHSKSRRKDLKNEIIRNFSLDRDLDMNVKSYSEKKIHNNLKFKTEKNIPCFKSIFFLCSKCNLFPLIEFIDYKRLIIKCDSSEIIENIINIDFFFGKYENKCENGSKAKDFINGYMKCKEHQKKYKYYCQNCNKDLCRQCLLLSKTHKTHKLKIFDFLIFDFNIKMKTILNKLYDNKLKKVLNPKFKGLYKIIKVIEANYSKYLSYNVFRTTANLYDYLLFNIDNVDYNKAQIKEIKIKRMQEISNTSNLNLITSIIISKQNINLEDICKANLINLDVLELPNNNINDISPLINAKFENLKLLNLSCNKIDNNNIPLFSKFKFKYLFHMNLSLNLLTDFKFLETIKNFPNLNHLLISSNKFALKDTDLYNTYDLSSLERLVLSDGVLLGDSIKILEKLKLDNIKIINLANNKISSLSFIKDIKYAKLKEIYINKNELESFKELENFKTLERIEISNNKINDFNDLEYLIKKIPNLKKINLKNNRIDIKEELNSEKLKLIKNKKNIKIAV